MRFLVVGLIACALVIDLFEFGVFLSVNGETTTIVSTSSGELQDFTEPFSTPDPTDVQDEVDDFETFDTKSQPQCKCGKAGDGVQSILNIHRKGGVEVDPLIIDGSNAAQDEFPWMVGISKLKVYEFNGSPVKIVCGGSLINSRFILTAAHCISKQSTTRYELLLRALNTTNAKANPKVLKLKAKRFIAHPNWNIKTVENDIGLIELSHSVKFTDGILPVCLPTKRDGDFANTNATVIGWGYTRPIGFMANILKKLVVPVISHQRCTQTRYGNIVTPTMLCAGYDEGGKDACTNDSGGPLTAVENGHHKLIGIVSWGHGCAQPALPGVYTRVTEYLDWIDSVVGKTKSQTCGV